MGRTGVFTTMGASNHSGLGRCEEDFYATSPTTLDRLGGRVKFHGKVWEPCCGTGTLSEWFRGKGYDVLSTDLVDRGYGRGGIDFLMVDKGEVEKWSKGEVFDIVTNPPYSCAEEIILRALDLVPKGGRVLMLLRTLFLEGKKRRERIHDWNPPCRVYQFSGRISCARNGNFGEYTSMAMAFAWFEWEKENKEHKTEIEWI